MSLKNERDSSIQNLFVKHNLGPLPKTPFGDEVVSNLTNRIKSRLMDLEKDLQDKRVTLCFYISGQIIHFNHAFMCAIFCLQNEPSFKHFHHFRRRYQNDYCVHISEI